MLYIDGMLGHDVEDQFVSIR